MNKLDDNAHSPQDRKYRRFTLQYPVCIKVQAPDTTIEFEGLSRNISICGVLLETSSAIPKSTHVSFVMTVPASDLGRPIQFVGEGKVVRVDRKGAEGMFAIAVECAQPITQFDRREARA